MDRLKLAQGLRNLPASAREDLAGREQDIQRGKTVELLRRAGKEMYENPIVNTAVGLSPVLGDIQAGVEAYRSAQEGDWSNAGLNAIGMLPFVPALGGILAGKSAKTADLVKLARAEEMTAAGLPREQVWNETGWFQAPDKQWKFEIPDYKAQFTPTPEFFTGQGNVRQYNVFEHPELQKAGYGIDDILIKRGSDEGGSFTPVLMNNQLIPRLSTVEIGTTAVKENPSGFSFSPLTAKNINLHELQHAIQYQEGFGKGGSPNTLAWQKEAAQSSIPELKANAREAQVAYDDAVDMGYGEKLINERKLALDNAMAELNSNLELANMGDPMDIYKRLSGEVESRLVQKRMQMTPEELKAAPPWTMYDVPEEQQIVRFDYDGIMNK